MKKAAIKYNPVFSVSPELEFNPLELAKENGLPYLKDDFRSMLDVELTGYRMLDDIERRLSLLQREVDFQMNRITEWSEENATKISPSDLAKIMRTRLRQRYIREGRSFSQMKVKEFDEPDKVLFSQRPKDSLPSSVEPRQILEQVLPFCQMKELLQKNESWRKNIFSSTSQHILIDAFWWLLLELFQKHIEDTSAVQAHLNTSIVSHYRELKENIDQYQRILFSKNYAELFSKWLYTAFLETFPSHGGQFKNKFKEQVVRCTARWTNTPVIPARMWRKWDPWLLVSDRVIGILRTSLRGGISGAELLRYDITTLDGDIARLRKEMSRGGTDSLSGGTSTTPPSTSPFFLRPSPSRQQGNTGPKSIIGKNVRDKNMSKEIVMEE